MKIKDDSVRGLIFILVVMMVGFIAYQSIEQLRIKDKSYANLQEALEAEFPDYKETLRTELPGVVSEAYSVDVIDNAVRITTVVFGSGDTKEENDIIIKWLRNRLASNSEIFREKLESFRDYAEELVGNRLPNAEIHLILIIVHENGEELFRLFI